MNIKHRTSLILTSIAVGWLFDFLFFKKAPGISFPIFVIVFLAGLLWLAIREKVKPALPSLILIAGTLFFAGMTVVREQPFLTAINLLLTLIGLGLLLVTYENGLWLNYSLSDFFMGALRLGAGAVANPIKFLSNKPDVKSGEAGSPRQRISFWSVLIGIFLAVPIVAALIGLLSSADPIFSQKIGDFFALFRIEKWGEYLFRGSYILVLAYLVIGVILHAITASGEKKLIGAEKPWLSPFLAWIQSIIILVAVNLVFLAFVIVQFQYFFGGQVNIVIDGYTYAEYARKGFNELVGVTLISLLLLFALTSVTKRETPKRRWSFSGLGTVLVLLVIVMLVSAFQRLMLYEQAYGFTRFRLQTHVLMIWLGILLISTLVLELVNKPRMIGLAALLVAFGFGLTMNVLNPDATIVKLNLKQGYLKQELDFRYLISLSSDSVPSLVGAFKDGDLSAATHDQLGVVLACKDYGLQTDRQDSSWQSFHFSRWLARKALISIESDLDAFPVIEDKFDVPEIKIGDDIVNCWAYYD